jgi:hypothetical protein
MGFGWWHSDHDSLGRVIFGEGGCGSRRFCLQPTKSHCDQKLLLLVKSEHWRVYLTAGVLDGIVSEGVVIGVMVGFSG